MRKKRQQVRSRFGGLSVSDGWRRTSNLQGGKEAAPNIEIYVSLYLFFFSWLTRTQVMAAVIKRVREHIETTYVRRPPPYWLS